jgi:Calcineurin-like phosphoesterase
LFWNRAPRVKETALRSRYPPSGDRSRTFLRIGIAKVGIAPAAFLVSALLLALTASAQAASRDRPQIWLAASDIHLDPFDRSARPSAFGSDSNAALFSSAVAQMKRAEPDPAVVLLPGDFLEHHFGERVRESGAPETSDQAGILTMQQIASALGRAFPTAQFAVALGNNDAPCGDYRSADGSTYLTDVARIWAPLVNRHNAAPDFAVTFARDGHYTLNLPVPRLRLVVVNSLLFSEQYRGSCSGAQGDATKELTWLKGTLRGTPAGTRNVVMMHIPPGFDPFSTQYVGAVFAWPFLRAPYNQALANALATGADRVAYAIAGHAHRFDFRLAGNVPIVVLGALSPVLDNNPAFYALHISGDGSLRDIDVHVFDEPLQKWMPARSFDATWGIAQVNAASLGRLHVRLSADPDMRRAWGAQAIGWPSTNVARSGTWGSGWWRVEWCAQTSLGSDYASCANIQGRLQLLRGVTIAFAAIAVAILALLALRYRLGTSQSISKRS